MSILPSSSEHRNESTEQKILRLMDEQARLAQKIEQLRETTPLDINVIQQLQRQHRTIANELTEALYEPLYRALKGLDPRLHNAGAQYTEMVHDFFIKLLDGRVTQGDFDQFADIKRWVATVLMNQFRDHLRRGKTLDKHSSAIAPIAEQKQHYFEERYRISFLDALDKLDQWEESGDKDLRLLGRALLLHYVGGEKWGDVARTLNISDERLLRLRKMLKEKFGGQ